MRCLFLGLVLCLAACQRAAPIDWDKLQGEQRATDSLTALEKANANHDWGDGEAELQLQYARLAFGRGARLTAAAQGAKGNATPFILDTGSSATILSARAPLMNEALVSRKHRFKVLQGTQTQGHLGQLPLLQVGSIAMREILVAIEESDHSLGEPSNIIGVPHIWNTQLEHAGERWSLRTMSRARPWDEAGWDHVPLVPGYPIAKARNPAGREVYALIDTGAPWSAAFDSSPRGTYQLLTDDGRVALRIDANRRPPWKSVAIKGMRMELVIGLDVLARRDFRLTFARARLSVRR